MLARSTLCDGARAQPPPRMRSYYVAFAMLDACNSFYGNFVVEHNRTALCIYPLHLHQSAAQVFKAPFCTTKKSFQAVSVWTDMSVLVELSDASASHLAREKKVILERARLMCDADVCTGLVRVQNIAYEKHIVVRYTLNDWESFSDLSAEWEESVWENDRLETDKFRFSIPLPTGARTLRVRFAVSYDVAGINFWDNNETMNYELEAKRSWSHLAWSAVRLLAQSRVRDISNIL